MSAYIPGDSKTNVIQNIQIHILHIQVFPISFKLASVLKGFIFEQSAEN